MISKKRAKTQIEGRGGMRVPPHLDIPNWNIKILNSSSDNWIIKSSG
jgi:hypothetical protein